jgi:hypothetical protein
VQYRGWNFEKTLLVHSRSRARERELIDVRIPVDARWAGNLGNDVRVVLKKDWNLIESEIPSQVYAIERNGPTASFRVAFSMDVPAQGYQRVGIYYHNPAAPAPNYPSRIDVDGDGLKATVKTPRCTLEMDERCGIAKAIVGRFDPPNLGARAVRFPDVLQEHGCVVFAVEEQGGIRAVETASAGWIDVELVEDVRGPVFVKRTIRGRPAYPGCPPRQRPIAEVTYKLFAEQGYFLARTRLVFPEDTNVFGLRVGGLTVNRDRCTHYTFRPVSPDLPETDIEEMGHILVDPLLTGDLPLGNAFSSLLPYDIAWDGFLNTRKGSEHAVACLQLQHSVACPRGAFPYYRSGAYLLRQEKTLCSGRWPIYVAIRDRRENRITIPAGTVVEELDAIVCDVFDREWGDRTDDMGRRLNSPVEISVHPRFMDGEVPPERSEPLPRGERRDAYLRYGVR